MPILVARWPGVEPFGMTRRQASLRVSARDTRAIHTPVRERFAGAALLTIQALARGLPLALITYMPERMVPFTAIMRRLEIGPRMTETDGSNLPNPRPIYSSNSRHDP